MFTSVVIFNWLFVCSQDQLVEQFYLNFWFLCYCDGWDITCIYLKGIKWERWKIEIIPPPLQKKRLCTTSIITTYKTFHSATLWTSDKPNSALSCVSVSLCHLYWYHLTYIEIWSQTNSKYWYFTKKSLKSHSETYFCSVLP